jgi:hypothetical protein
LPTAEAAASGGATSLTAERDEEKYLLPEAAARAFARELEPRLIPPRQFASGLPAAEQYSTTVYLDTEAHALYRAALREPVHLKVRVREYQSAEGAAQGGSDGTHDYPTAVFVELKVREGQRSRKRRARVPRRALARFFEELAVSADLRALEPKGGSELDDIAAELRAVRANLGQPLAPSCVVRYLRLSWEDPSCALRVTLDRELGVFAPPAALWDEGPLSPPRLGPVLFQEPACVLEVKRRGRQPEWLAPLLADHAARPVEYSKFVLASRAVHGLG